MRRRGGGEDFYDLIIPARQTQSLMESPRFSPHRFIKPGDPSSFPFPPLALFRHSLEVSRSDTRGLNCAATFSFLDGAYVQERAVFGSIRLRNAKLQPLISPLPPFKCTRSLQLYPSPSSSSFLIANEIERTRGKGGGGGGGRGPAVATLFCARPLHYA